MHVKQWRTSGCLGLRDGLKHYRIVALERGNIKIAGLVLIPQLVTESRAGGLIFPFRHECLELRFGK
jgi:hypothetical protein